MFQSFFSLFTRATGALAEIASTVAPEITATLDPESTAEVLEQTPAEGILAIVIQFAPILLIGVVFYFLMIRPQRKKDKKVKDMLAAVKVGDRVTTIGGIHGTVVAVKDDILTVVVGQDKTKLVFAKWAIRTVDEISISNEQESLT
ncbi:MAG: preprotein translocase subunit YajC [Oscillospiraceae bacterium]|nr:preprotein translocase subunit YajC [Oscillospiraceae bacterium]